MQCKLGVGDWGSIASQFIISNLTIRYLDAGGESTVVGQRPRIASTSDTWLSSRIVPVARSKAARAFRYALLATTTVDLACARKL
jgi:hypothetical protein